MARHSHSITSNHHVLPTSKFLINGLIALLLTLGMGSWAWYQHGEKTVERDLAEGKIHYGGKVASPQSLIAVGSGNGRHFMLNDDKVEQEATSEQAKSADSLLPASLTSCHDQVEALELTIAQLQSTNTQLLNEVSAEHIKHRKEVNILRKEVAQLFGEVTKEQETNQELLVRVGELEGKWGEATNLVGSLSSENDRLQGKVTSLTEQLGALQGQSSQSSQSLDSELQAQLDSLNSQVSALQQQLAQSQSTSSDSLGSQMSQTVYENGQLQLQLASLNDQLTSSQNQVTSLTAQNAALQGQLQSALENADASLQSQLASAREENITLTLQNSTLASRVSELTQKLADETQQIAEAHAKLEQLNEQVIGMVDQLSDTMNQIGNPIPTAVIGDESVGQSVSVDIPVTPIVVDAPETVIVQDVVNDPDTSIIPNIVIVSGSVIPNIVDVSDTSITSDVVNAPDTSIIPNIVNDPDTSIIPNVVIVSDTSVIPISSESPTVPYTSPTTDTSGVIVSDATAVLPNILNEPASLTNPSDSESIAQSGKESTLTHLKHLFWGF